MTKRLLRWFLVWFVICALIIVGLALLTGSARISAQLILIAMYLLSGSLLATFALYATLRQQWADLSNLVDLILPLLLSIPVAFRLQEFLVDRHTGEVTYYIEQQILPKLKQFQLETGSVPSTYLIRTDSTPPDETLLQRAGVRYEMVFPRAQAGSQEPADRRAIGYRFSIPVSYLDLLVWDSSTKVWTRCTSGHVELLVQQIRTYLPSYPTPKSSYPRCPVG